MTDFHDVVALSWELDWNSLCYVRPAGFTLCDPVKPAYTAIADTAIKVTESKTHSFQLHFQLHFLFSL